MGQDDVLREKCFQCETRHVVESRAAFCLLSLVLAVAAERKQIVSLIMWTNFCAKNLNTSTGIKGGTKTNVEDSLRQLGQIFRINLKQNEEQNKKQSAYGYTESRSMSSIHHPLLTTAGVFPCAGQVTSGLLQTHTWSTWKKPRH